MILIEFNELVPSLMERFIAEGALPSFERFRGEAEVAVTEADEDHRTSSRGSSGSRCTGMPYRDTSPTTPPARWR